MHCFFMYNIFYVNNLLYTYLICTMWRVFSCRMYVQLSNCMSQLYIEVMKTINHISLCVTLFCVIICVILSSLS